MPQTSGDHFSNLLILKGQSWYIPLMISVEYNWKTIFEQSSKEIIGSWKWEKRSIKCTLNHKYLIWKIIVNRAKVYTVKDNNINTRQRCKRFKVNNKVKKMTSIDLTLNLFHTYFWSFFCLLWMDERFIKCIRFLENVYN